MWVRVFNLHFFDKMKSRRHKERWHLILSWFRAENIPPILLRSLLQRAASEGSFSHRKKCTTTAKAEAKPLQPGSRVCQHLPPRTRASFGPDTQPTPAEDQVSAFNPWGRSRTAGSRTFPADPSGSQACDRSSRSRAQKGSTTRQLCSSIAHTARPSGLLQQVPGEGSGLDHRCSRLPARMAVKWPLRNRDGHCSRHSQRSSDARNLCWAAADCPRSRRALQTASTRG